VNCHEALHGVMGFSVLQNGGREYSDGCVSSSDGRSLSLPSASVVPGVNSLREQGYQVVAELAPPYCDSLLLAVWPDDCHIDVKDGVRGSDLYGEPQSVVSLIRSPWHSMTVYDVFDCVEQSTSGSDAATMVLRGSAEDAWAQWSASGSDDYRLARQWREAGVEPSASQQWRSLGTSPGEAGEWLLVTSTESAVLWLSAGVRNPGSREKWMTCAPNEMSAIEWAGSGIPLLDVPGWQALGCTPHEALFWRHHQPVLGALVASGLTARQATEQARTSS
jgi:hypothetical protein